MAFPLRPVAILSGAWLALCLPVARGQAILYVDAQCPASYPPFDSWANAATNIQEACDYAADGDTILVTNGDYYVATQINLEVSITFESVNGPGATRIIAVSNRCLQLSAPAVIDGFSFTNGYVNSAPVHGAGIHAAVTGAVIRNCRFENNYTGANGQGGGLWLGPSGTVENCTFSRNRADVGGGLYASNGLALAGCTFTGNWTSAGSGGGAYATGSATVTNCDFIANQAGTGTSSEGGGAFCTWATNAATLIRNCRYVDNDSKLQGGAVTLRRGGTILDYIFSANTATNEGGAVYLDDTNCLLQRCELRNNSAAGGGGAIYGRSLVADCLVVSNQASSGGGLYGMSTMQIERTVVQSNLANNGGGLYGAGTVIARNCLFTGNTATNRGGGFYLASKGLLENCTVAANTATSAAGFYGSATAITVLNSIVHANLGPNVSNRYPSIVFDHVCTDPEIAGDGNLTNDPAFLLPAAGNFRLGPGSLCRDAGTNQAWMLAATDLAAAPRLVGPVDLGAYETGLLAADFTAIPAFGVAPLEVVLSGAATGTNTDTLAWRWDFNNDGAYDAAGLCVTNSYSAGIYSVRLEVSNDVGEVASVVKTNWITAQGGVSADFTANVRTGAAPFVVQFTDLSANSPQFWAWDFENDGTVDSTSQNPEWTFSATGQFTVALTVSNDFGGGNFSSDTVVKTNFIAVPVLQLVADFTVSPVNAQTYDTIQFTDTSSNGPTSWTWYFRNVGTGDSFEQNPTSYYSSAGYKTVKLVVSNEWSAATVIKTNLLRIEGLTPYHYVSTNGASSPPYTDWAGAAQTIAEALDEAEVFDTVLVSNGTYGVPFLGLTCNGLTLASVNGPEVTAISGGGAENIVRAAAEREEPTLIYGFTLTNGYASGDAGGAWITRNVTLSNCVVSGCRADDDAGGILLDSGGLVTHCEVLGNTAGGAGGGLKIIDSGTVWHCRVAGNVASNGGGGIHAYSTNSPDAVEIGFCRLQDNHAAGIESGGGVYLWHGRIHDSLIVSNSASTGGGLYGNLAIVRHCTLSGNSATNGGGLYASGCEVRNCIAWDNTRSNLFLSGAGNTVETCDILPAPAGIGNRDTDPLFRDPGTGDYRLKYSSGAIDSGTATELDLDLVGTPRPLDGNFDSTPDPDMGAFEYDPETADSNGDGVPDWWYRSYSLDPLDPAIAVGHADTDPFDNGSEWVALTDPTNADSYFAIDTLEAGATVYFNSWTNRQYLLQRCTNLIAGVWTNLPGVPARLGLGGPDSFSDPVPPATSAVYRVQVRIP